MDRIKTFFTNIFILISITSYATTWDEPWQDEVIKEAEYFVFAKVLSNDEKKGVTIEIIKSLGGKELPDTLEIRDFYLLHICSFTNGHGPGFHFESIKECYFFIKKNADGKYCIATPSAGFAFLKDGNVHATYRHSYHQALVQADIYEKTMTAVFNNYHNQPYDKDFVTNYVNQYISLLPTILSKNEMNTFFAQHVALECVYHLRLPGFYSKIIPFLKDTANTHAQISAARALVPYNTPECKQELLKIISDPAEGDFLQVICIWTLTEFKPVELKKLLKKAAKKASTENNGFGGDIMDPRICTHFPEVKSAIEKLVKTL